ncbi:hypothetical protein E4U52_004490 [Claviceps spartinae]|nr:hypothetical protein E4U52_004490 [Claviceps spartinae]
MHQYVTGGMLDSLSEPQATGAAWASQLNSGHLAVRCIFGRYCCDVKNDRAPPPILMHVDGAGGTSKSIFINVVCDDGRSRDRATRITDCKYIILHEKSMIDLRALHSIDQRSLQVYVVPHKSTPFSGRSILLLGDFAQLPSVFDKPLYERGPLNVAADAHD